MYFADATFLVAASNTRDQHHAKAKRELARILDEGGSEPPLVLTDYVFDETITALLYRTGRHALVAAAGRILLSSKGIRMVRVSEPIFDDAWRLFLERGDKKWSFTDCTSFKTMEALRLDTALSFDTDFAQAGFSMRP